MVRDQLAAISARFRACGCRTRRNRGVGRGQGRSPPTWTGSPAWLGQSRIDHQKRAWSPQKSRPSQKSRSPQKSRGTRAAQALTLVRGQPGITIPELEAKMGIKQNYLYRVLPDSSRNESSASEAEAGIPERAATGEALPRRAATGTARDKRGATPRKSFLGPHSGTVAARSTLVTSPGSGEERGPGGVAIALAPQASAVCLCSTPRPRLRRFRRLTGIGRRSGQQGQFPNRTPTSRIAQGSARSPGY